MFHAFHTPILKMDKYHAAKGRKNAQRVYPPSILNQNTGKNEILNNGRQQKSPPFMMILINPAKETAKHPTFRFAWQHTIVIFTESISESGIFLQRGMMLIGNILKHVASELDAYIQRHVGINPSPYVMLSPIVNPDGTTPMLRENVILLTLMDVRQDAATPYVVKMNYQNSDGVNYSANTSALHVNLFMLFVMNFESDKYKDALNFMSYVLQYFQSKPVFTRQNTPNMPLGMEKLEFTIETQDFQQKGYMWGLLGIKYMPFVLYKARLLTFYDDEPETFVPPVQEPHTDASLP
jgi:hypothetical protein